MKIAQVVCTFPPYKGGIGNSAFSFARELTKAGFDVTTLTPNYKNDKSEEEKECGKIIRPKPLFKHGNGAFIPGIWKELKKVDAIYLHYPFFGGVEVVWLYKLLNPKKKLAIHYHMDIVGLSLLAKILSLPARLISKSLFKRADIITCASLDYIANSQIANFYLKNKNKFQEIPFGVDVDRFKPAIKRSSVSKLEAEPLKILFVGALDKAHYFKGLDVLLKALAKTQDKNWRLEIVGDGDLRPNYENFACELKLENRVKFLEEISDEELPKIYQKADIFVLPSIDKSEAFGLVLLEALSSGLPVIASNLPGVRSIFKDGEQGLLIEPKNIDDLKEKIDKLLEDKKLRESMSKNARSLVEEKYTWEKDRERLAQLFT